MNCLNEGEPDERGYDGMKTVTNPTIEIKLSYQNNSKTID